MTTRVVSAEVSTARHAGLSAESSGPERIPFVGWGNPLQVRAEVETPFKDGNISVDHQRWALISRDTLPAYRELLEQDPEGVREILSTPVDERIEDWRLWERRDEIAAQLADWDVRVEQ